MSSPRGRDAIVCMLRTVRPCNGKIANVDLKACAFAAQSFSNKVVAVGMGSIRLLPRYFAVFVIGE